MENASKVLAIMTSRASETAGRPRRMLRISFTKRGEGRLAFEEGNVNIHTVSALSIERVTVERGREHL